MLRILPLLNLLFFIKGVHLPGFVRSSCSTPPNFGPGLPVHIPQKTPALPGVAGAAEAVRAMNARMIVRYFMMKLLLIIQSEG